MEYLEFTKFTVQTTVTGSHTQLFIKVRVPNSLPLLKIRSGKEPPSYQFTSTPLGIDHY